MITASLDPIRRTIFAGFSSGRYQALLGAIAIGGIGLSTFSFINVVDGEHTAFKAAFHAASENRLDHVQREIDLTLEAVETLGTYFESSYKVDEIEFQRFAEGILERLPTVRALQWIDRVPAASRENYETTYIAGDSGLRVWEQGKNGRVVAETRQIYFPVRFIASNKEAIDIAGFDMGSEERRRAALVDAAGSGHLVVSRPITLIYGDRMHSAVLVVRPAYDSSGNAHLLGYASSAISIADIVTRAHTRFTGQRLDLKIDERGDTGHGAVLYETGSTGGNARKSSAIRHDAVLHVGNQTWNVRFTPAEGYASYRTSSLALLVLIGGLVTTAILFFYIRALYHSALSSHRANMALRLRDRAIEASTDAIMIVRLSRRQPLIEYVNAAFERITGYARAEVLGADWRVLQGGAISHHIESSLETMLRTRDEGAMVLRSYRKDGTPFWNSLHVAPVSDEHGRRTHLVAIIDDVTETKSYQEQLEHQATHDVLTGLPNRALLIDRITQAIAQARRNERLMALVFVDLDHFKRINDGYGHGTGDQVLRIVASRIADSLRANDTVARYAGDEFVIVLDDQADEGAVSQFCKRLSSALSVPLFIDDRELLLSASFGVSLFPRDGSDAEALLQNADTAMYRVKDEGRGGTQFFTQKIGTDMHQRLSLEQSLRRAVERGEFFLEYQPRVDLSDGSICGMEALVRWERPGHGRVAPAQFIGLAEDSGLIVPIGEWVLETACKQAVAWTGMRGSFVMSVNLSPRQFRQRELVDLVDRVVSTSGLDPRRLELEVTESSMMHDVQQASRTLRALSLLGVRLALDDFGTGYSSLAYLKTFPIDDLKIDQSFVRDVVHEKEDAQISRAIIGLARALGLRVVAEGVENSEQLRFLCEHGCDEGQGYLFAKPMPADVFGQWVAQWDPRQFEFKAATRGRVIPLRR